MKRCAYCGGEIPSSRRSNAKYCSEKCARLVQARAQMNSITSRANKINLVAHSIYHAYGHKCALCGWQATPDEIAVNGHIQYAHGNQIHHITPIRDGGTEEYTNVILLCPNHHKQADFGIISREELRKHTRPYEMTQEEIHAAKARCADAIAAAIFGTEN